MPALRIILMSIAAAVIYGVLHDQITARICVEYFTIGHPPVFGTADPTLLALGWGVIATWWAGLLIGVPLAIAARAGTRPKRTVGTLVQPVVKLLLFMAVCACLAGIVGWVLARNGAVFLVGSIADQVPKDRHVPYLADLWAHSASYLSGFVGGVILVVHVWRSRGRVSSKFD